MAGEGKRKWDWGAGEGESGTGWARRLRHGPGSGETETRSWECSRVGDWDWKPVSVGGGDRLELAGPGNWDDEPRVGKGYGRRDQLCGEWAEESVSTKTCAPPEPGVELRIPESQHVFVVSIYL